MICRIFCRIEHAWNGIERLLAQQEKIKQHELA